MDTTTHEGYFSRAQKVSPGGVHSPVRSFKTLSMAPRFMRHGRGPYLIDATGKTYIDFCMSFGPLILGHGNEQVKRALQEGVESATTFGAADIYSLELAEYILENIPLKGQIRFVNSGTEAVTTAIRLARGFTEKNKIIKFKGCYHGHVDSLLVSAGSGVSDLSQSTSKGIPRGVIEDTLVAPLFDLPHLEQLIEKHRGQIAAIIIEPLPANDGLMIPPPYWLKEVKELCQKNQMLLIFDEVISGFRVAFGGMMEKSGVIPDIVTLGKIIGGGLPVGAVVASSTIMSELSPLGQVYQAGTLSANPLGMRAGLAVLKQLTPTFYQQLEMTSAKICKMFDSYFAKNPKYQYIKITRYESLFWFHLEDETKMGMHYQTLFSELYADFINRGIYLSPHHVEAGFISSAHQDILDELSDQLQL